MGDKVRVGVRVRPLNRRELELGTKCVVHMEGNQTRLQHPSGSLNGKAPKSFNYDHCFWSADPSAGDFVGQKDVFEALGHPVLDNALQGYNACVLAYGQTGSGKTYTMMGSEGEDAGVIPRLCRSIFQAIAERENPTLAFKVEVSYMEIYNEKVRDLLDPSATKPNLRVREHTILGPYVDGLSISAVSSFEEISGLMKEGNQSRTVAATNMNMESSRSHAVFNIQLTQTLIDEASGTSGEKVAKISLVDLAGSERAQKSGAVGKRLEEGSNINKSLTTLGMVISALAKSSASSAKEKKFVPYRDSVLTWLLRENLGGNSKTVMVATISPAGDNYEETLSTLRYADSAKQIVCRAVVNEDPNAKIIRELRAEVEALRAQIAGQSQTVDLRDRLAESEKLVEERSRTWEDRLRETQRLHEQRQRAFEEMGVSLQGQGIKVETGRFFLVNLNADPSLNELLVYYLMKERTVIGQPDPAAPPDSQPDIQLRGLGIQKRHAELLLQDGALAVLPSPGAKTCVNGVKIGVSTALKNGDRIVVGHNHFFRVNCPKKEARKPLPKPVTATGEASKDSEAAKSPGEDKEAASIVDAIPSPMEESGHSPIVDYDMAREEVTLAELSNDPITVAVAELEKQHAEDKEAALDRQRAMYEDQLRALRSHITPAQSPSIEQLWSPMGPLGPLGLGPLTPMTPATPSGASRFPPSLVKSKYDEWLAEREAQFLASLARLKEEIVRANTAVREANLMAADLGNQTSYSVTLQIPAANLTPSKIKKGAFVSEPAILVKRKHLGSQIWSLDKLENKLVDMRELYHQNTPGVPQEQEEGSGNGSVQISPQAVDPFFESHENHNLIGVANVFLEVLFHNVRLDISVPIISQQGEVAGRLHVEIYRLSPANLGGALLNGGPTSPLTSDPLDSAQGDDEDVDGSSSRVMRCRIRIKEARGLPAGLAHFVFCQYSWWGGSETIVVPPALDAEATPAGQVAKAQGVNSRFQHQRDFTVDLDKLEEFREFVAEDALSIEVWGHKAGSASAPANAKTAIARPLSSAQLEVETLQQVKTKSLQDRWAEVSQRLELAIEIHELSDSGAYSPVQVTKPPDALTGGVYQLRQGQQRRIVVKIRTLEEGGLLPVVFTHITSLSVGCVCTRNRNLQKPLDSYQETDLDILKDRWNEALKERREYLDGQIQGLMQKPDKTEEDAEREGSLIAQWVALTEERNAVCLPAANSAIPGAPADWAPPPGTERHIPVLFLALPPHSDLPSTHDAPTVAGTLSILPKEHSSKMFNLPLLRHSEDEASVTASWDSSIHEHPALNRVTPGHERVYAILKVIVRLSHPSEMELVLRKRLCFNIYSRPSITERLYRRFVAAPDSLASTAVHYDLVAHIPKSSMDVEDRASLALVAARSESGIHTDGESYMEKYTRGISQVESILALDRSRQEVVISELLGRQSRRQSGTPASLATPSGPMKRASSMPTKISPSPATSPPQEPAQGLPPLPGGNLVSSLASPGAGGGLLGGSRRRQVAMPPVAEEAGKAEAPSRSQTCHSISSAAAAAPALSPPAKDARPPGDASVTSSGYGSQLLSSKSSDSVDVVVAPPPPAPPTHPLAQDEDLQASPLPRQKALSSSSHGLLSPPPVHPSMTTSTYSDYGAKVMNLSTASVSSNADAETMASSTASGESDEVLPLVPAWLRRGATVETTDGAKAGAVRYIGPVEFDKGIWVGLGLDAPTGDHDGEVQGVRYFATDKNSAHFATPNQLRPKQM